MTKEKNVTDSNLLSPKAVATLFGVTPRTIARWANDGKLPVVYTSGGHRRYPTREVLAIRTETRCPSCGTNVGIDGATCFIDSCKNYGKSIISTNRSIAMREHAREVVRLWHAGEEDLMDEAIESLEKVL